METLDTQTWIIIAAVVVLGLVALGAWIFYQKKQSQKLQERFGPEYGRTVNELGSRTKGESELKAREKRVERLEIIRSGTVGSRQIQRGLASITGPIRR